MRITEPPTTQLCDAYRLAIGKVLSTHPIPPERPRGPDRLFLFPRPLRHRRWLRVLAWTVGIIAILIVVGVVGLWLMVRSAWFHGKVLRYADSQASAALHTPVRLQNYNLHFSLSTPAIDAYNITVAGASPYPSPPLLQIAHLHVGIRVISLLKRQWRLQSIVVDRPLIHLYIAPNGVNNLPNLSSGQSGGSGSTNIFKLGIRQAVVNHGWIWFNDREQTLSARLQGVRFEAGFNSARQAYSGNFGYRSGVVQYGAYRPLAQQLAVRFDATPSRLKLLPLTLSSPVGRLDMDATASDYAQPAVHCTYRMRLDAGQLRAILRNASVPAGVILTAGNLDYVSRPGRGLWQSLRIVGTVSSSALVAAASGKRIALSGLHGQYRLAHDNFSSGLQARLLGGTVTAQVRMAALGSARGAGSATLVARGQRLQQLMTTAAGPGGNRLAHARLRGAANLDAAARWRGSFNDLTARLDAVLHAVLLNPAGPPTVRNSAAPLNAAIHARYAARSQQLALNQTYFTMPATRLRVQGALGLDRRHRARLAIVFASSNLHELETVAGLLRASPGKVPAPLGLYGRGSFQGQVTGSLSRPRFTGALAASNLRLHGTGWRSLRVSIAARPSQVRISRGQLLALPSGSIAFSLDAGLHQWGFTSTSPLRANVTASRLNLAALAKAAGQTSPLSGILSARFVVHGSVKNPIGNGAVTVAPALLKTSGIREPIQTLQIVFHGNGARVHGGLTVKMPAGVATLTGIYNPPSQAYNVQLRADNIQTRKLRLASNYGLAGVINLDGAGQGTLSHPQFHATLQSPRLLLANQAIAPFTLNAVYAHQAVQATLAARAAAAAAWLRGNLNLSLRGEEPLTARLDTQPFPLGPLLAAYSPSLAGSIAGSTEIHLTANGPLKHFNRMRAMVNLPVFQLNYQNKVRLGAAAPIRFQLANGLLRVRSAHIEGTGTNLQLTGSIPVRGNSGMAMHLLGAVDLRIAEIADSSLRTGGQLQMALDAGGSLSSPRLGGNIKIVNAALSTSSLPVGLANGNGVLTLTPQRLLISSFTANVGGGQVTASGGVTYRPSLVFDLGLAGKYISLLYPRSLRETFGGNLSLTGNMQAALLAGQIKLYRLDATPQFNLTTLTSQLGGAGAAPPPGSFSQNLNLRITLTTPNGITTQTPDFSMSGAANLVIQGTAAEPVVLGRLNIDRGDILFNGNRFLLQSGTLMFANPAQTVPNVNLAADTTIQQYKLHLRFQGPADHLRTQYTSSPPLPPADIINLLAFGVTTEASAANPTPGTLGAEDLVASQVASQVTSRVQEFAGISQLSVDPLLGGNGQNPGARVNIRQRVTGNLYITLSTDVTSTQNNLIEIQYNFSPKKSVDLVRDQNGGFHLNTSFKKRW